MLSGFRRVSRSGVSRLVAFLTVQERTEMLLTSMSGKDPWAVEERWVMTNMLSVTTGQISDPVAILILVIINDRLLHVVRSLSSIMIIA